MIELFYWQDGQLQLSKHDSLGNALSKAYKLHAIENLHLESLHADGEKYDRTAVLEMIEEV